MRLLFIVSIIVLFQGIQLVAAYDWNDIDPPYPFHDCERGGAQASVSESEYGLTYFKIYHPSSGLQWTWTYFAGDYEITGYTHIIVTFTGVLDAYIRGTYIRGLPPVIGYARIIIYIGLLEYGELYDWDVVYDKTEWYDYELEIEEVFTKGELCGTFTTHAPAHEYAPIVYIYSYATGIESEVTRDKYSSSSAYLTVSCISWDNYY
jgi:hypothetical protein